MHATRESLSTTASPLIGLDGIELSVEGRSLLRGFDLAIEAGEIVAVTGPSGVGKTTLLRTIAGLASAKVGAVRFRGAAIDGASMPSFRRQVVYVAQKPVLLDASIEENLARAFSYRSAQGVVFDRKRALRLLAEVGLDAEPMEKSARKLSAGQQHRVAIVRALLLDPTVLLLDEPTSALDATTAELVLGLIATWVGEGERAAVIVTHDLAAAARCGARRVDLGGGAVAT